MERRSQRAGRGGVPSSDTGGAVRRVAAFAAGVLEGNPAGVVVAPAFPPDREMQRIAAAVGDSETAFVVPADSDGASFAIRFFTPTTEVALCGHATLAAAFVIAGSAAMRRLRFVAPAATLETEVTRDGDGVRIRMRFPADPPGEPIEGDERATLLADLGLRSAVSLRRTRFDLLVELESERQVTHYQAGFADLGRIDTRGIVVTAPADPGGHHDLVSRFFAPRCGIAEDPVTGSAHAALGPFWSERLGRRRLLAYQASERGGLVHLEVEESGAHVWIGGAARSLGG